MADETMNEITVPCDTSKLSYEERSIYECKVCGNVPDEFGVIEHGKGCYTQGEDGGGCSFVEFK